MALIDFHILIQSLVYFLTGVCGLIVVTTFAINKVRTKYEIFILRNKNRKDELETHWKRCCLRNLTIIITHNCSRRHFDLTLYIFFQSK